MSDPPRILFVDDDADVQKAASLLLPRRGMALLSARSPEEAWSVLAGTPVDVVLLDLNFQPGSTAGTEGLRCLEALLLHDPDRVVVIVTGHSGINIAVAAMRAGAADFVMKPWSNDRLIATLTEAVALRRKRVSARAAQPGVSGETQLPPMIGDSPGLRRAVELAARTASSDAPILLFGEAGTGKSLLAHSIHRMSLGRDQAISILDPVSLWDQGEATWSHTLDRMMPASTLVLDEVGSLPPGLQSALLAFLGTRPALRLLATTRRSRDGLAQALQADLLYRLNVVEISLPPLRERGDDARLLAAHFLRSFARRYGRGEMTLSSDALDAIASSAWPANVRGLEHAMERAVVLHEGTAALRPQDIPLAASLPDGVPIPVPGDGDLNLRRSEKAVVEAALQRHGFNVSRAAKELGLTRASLYRRMGRHQL